eukprot:Gb_05084 [translate_table: standard]
MPSSTQSGGRSQLPSSSALFSSESVHLSSTKGKKREWAEQNAGNHHHQQISSSNLEDNHTKSQKREHSMKLVDVSTLTDGKGGLASLSNVEQLVFLMRIEWNDGLKKSTDVIRQWKTVAGVIAATEQGECLNHFIHLGGLNLLEEWLQEAQKGKIGESDKVAEEFISTLLNALESLPIDLEDLQACRIRKSVKPLRNHKNSDIQRKAVNLINIWKKNIDVDMKMWDETKGGSNNDTVEVHAIENGLYPEGTNSKCSKTPGSSIIGGNFDKGSDEGEAFGGKVQKNSATVNMAVLPSEELKDGSVSICQQEKPGAVGVVNLNGVVVEECISKPSCLESSSNKSCLDAEEASVHSLEAVAATGVQSSPKVKEKDMKLEGAAESAEPIEFDNEVGRGNSRAHAGERKGDVHQSKVTGRYISKESHCCLDASRAAVLGQDISTTSPLANVKAPSNASLEGHNVNSPKGISGTLPISCQPDEKDKRAESCQKKVFRPLDTGSISTSIMSSLNSSSGDHQPSNMPLKMVHDDSSRYWEGLEPKSECRVSEDSQTRISKSAEEASETSYSAGNQEGIGTIIEEERTYRRNDAMVTSPCDESASRINTRENSADLEEGNKASKSWLDQKNSEEHVEMASEIDLRFVEDDALEVARQVAKEVEQEVESYNEPSCSSSEKDVRGAAAHTSTAESAGEDQKPFISQLYHEEEIPKKQNADDSCYSSEEEIDLKVQTGNEEQSLEGKFASEEMNCSATRVKVSTQEMGACMVAVTSQESITDEAQGKTTNSNDQIQTPKRFVFDLNEDIPIEEGECPQDLIDPPIAATPTASTYTNNNVSTPIPVVAASKGPLVLPTAPLHFEGKLGWRGSAATSAFRPAEPRQTPDRDRTQSIEENNSAPKLGCRFFEIDLNVVDDNDDAAMDFFSEGHGGERHLPASSSLPSGDSSVEVSSSRRAERLNLDLNRLGETDDNGLTSLSDWRGVERLGDLQKPDRSPSPTSSSRAAMRDFDLNDHPVCDDASASAHDFQQPEYIAKSYNSSKLDDPVVSILGTRIDLDSRNLPPTHVSSLAAPWDFRQGHVRKEFPNSTHSFLVSGPSTVSSVGNMGRMVPVSPALTYAAPSLPFPYNGSALGSTFPLNPAVFTSGGVPYMVDSLGAPMQPQILGPATLSPPFSRPPYLMGVAGGVGANNTNRILRPNLDLNACLASAEAEGREAGGNTRQLFLPGSHLLVEEQMRTFQQVASSGASLKRKEPECGWEPHQVGYKQATTWH